VATFTASVATFTASEETVTGKPVVFVVSDSMGETAHLVARAALSQFPNGEVGLRRFSQVDTPEAAREVMAAARTQPTIIIFTVIIPWVREIIQAEALRDSIPVVDIMGPALAGLERITGRSALLEPGLIHRLDEKYFRRVEAVEFAVQHDDGKNPRGYRKADVVLLGVSRSSKTPVSMYLAHRGVKVANLPLVPEVPPPSDLYRIPARKIVGLTIGAVKLASIRHVRVKAMGVESRSDYSDMARIRQELAFSEKLYRELGCEVLDVTDRAVEETATMVLQMVNNMRSPGD
jgi:[pyruvate, water dikinase]-phosphate phosphotransferase / [pyruvate, water dikinase] kinase